MAVHTAWSEGTAAAAAKGKWALAGVAQIVGMSSQTKRLWVQFPARAHAEVPTW